MKYLTALLLALTLALAACGDDDDSQTLDSGIEGLVLAGPQCPVVQEGSPCPDLPIEASIRIAPVNGGEAVVALSDENGRFRVPQLPGEYDVEPLPFEDQPLPAPGPAQRVTVEAGRFAEITITYDTGIR